MASPRRDRPRRERGQAGRGGTRRGRPGRFRGDRSGDVAEEQVVLVSGRDAAAKQEILVRSRHHRPAQPERARRCRAAVRRHHHRNAVAEGEVARTAGVRDQEPGGPARRAAVDDEPVGRRVVAAQEGVQRDRAAPSGVVGRRQDRARRSARAHVHEASIGEAGDGLVEAVEIERSAARDRHCRIRAERVQRACAQRARADIRRAVIAVGTC